MSDGKWLEGQVKKLFDEESKQIKFSYERLYDARAARGKFQPQPSDFLVNCTGPSGPRSVYIECKETESDSQISLGDFPQFPRMKVKMLAGAGGILVVYHTKTKKFRVVPLSSFPLSTSVFKLEPFGFQGLEFLLKACYRWEWD